jgi:4-hydroxy-tetrahydrodipicolinate synthase
MRNNSNATGTRSEARGLGRRRSAPRAGERRGGAQAAAAAAAAAASLPGGGQQNPGGAAGTHAKGESITSPSAGASNLHGVIVPLVTPFTAAGELDEPSFDRLVESLLGAGVHGLALNGTSGESPTLGWSEVERLTARLVSLVGGALPVLLGTGSANTAETVERTRRARALGAAGALVVVPYYSRPAPAGVLAHFRAVAAVGLPVVAYHIPYRTSLELGRETLHAILDLPGVVGIKECSGGLANTIALVRRAQGSVLCGEDLLFLAALAHGAPGGIAAAANLLAREFVAVYQAARADRFAEARRLFAAITPIIELLFAEPNPSPLKWALARRGVIASAAVRLPLTPISSGLALALDKLATEIPS